MRFVSAAIVRDWRIALTRGPALTIDIVAVLVSAIVFFYLAEYVDHGEDYFAFVLAGLPILRIHTAVPRVLALTTGRIADGSLEIVVSGRSRAWVVMLGDAAFELLRGVVLSVLLLVFAIGVLGADVTLTAAGLVAIAVGLIGSAAVLLGLTIGLTAMLMVLREAGAASSLSGVFLPILGGVYFPLSVLPAPLEALVEVLPFHWPVDVLRAGLTEGRFPVTDALVSVVAAAVTIGVGAALAAPAVGRARRGGRLALE